MYCVNPKSGCFLFSVPLFHIVVFLLFPFQTTFTDTIQKRHFTNHDDSQTTKHHKWTIRDYLLISYIFLLLTYFVFLHFCRKTAAFCRREIFKTTEVWWKDTFWCLVRITCKTFWLESKVNEDCLSLVLSTEEKQANTRASILYFLSICCFWCDFYFFISPSCGEGWTLAPVCLICQLLQKFCCDRNQSFTVRLIISAHELQLYEMETGLSWNSCRVSAAGAKKNKPDLNGCDWTGAQIQAHQHNHEESYCVQGNSVNTTNHCVISLHWLKFANVKLYISYVKYLPVLWRI